jgi:hypothetical protein
MIKTTDGNCKYDIDSITNEQVDFYSKLFQSEGWDENSAHELTRYIVNKLDNNEKETLDEDIKTIMPSSFSSSAYCIDVLYHSVCFTYVPTLYKPFLILFQNFINLFGKI